MRLAYVFVGVALVVTTASCSSSEPSRSDGGTTSDGGTDHDHDAGTVMDSGTGAGDGGGTGAQPAAPQLTTVAKMMNALHVMWTNREPSCDTIEGERKTSTAAYAVAFTVPGDADNKHDTGATQNTTYTYRLRCKKGGVYSAYSNEMSGNPQ